VKKIMLLLAAAILTLSLSAPIARADGNPMCPPQLGCPK